MVCAESHTFWGMSAPAALCSRTRISLTANSPRRRCGEANPACVPSLTRPRMPFLMMNPQGNISYWNPAAERILGYTSAEAIGQNLHSLIMPPRYYRSAAGHLPGISADRTGLRRGQNARYWRPGEKTARKSLFSYRFPPSKSMTAGVPSGILDDITERKRAEEALRRYAAELESAKTVQEENATRLRQLVEELGEAKGPRKPPTGRRASSWPI